MSNNASDLSVNQRAYWLGIKSNFDAAEPDPTDPDVTFSNLTVTVPPQPLTAATSITVDITNNTGNDETVFAQLRIGEDIVETQTIPVSGNTTETTGFGYIWPDYGDYTITVNTESENVSIRPF